MAVEFYFLIYSKRYFYKKGLPLTFYIINYQVSNCVMALYYDLPVYKDVYSLILLLYRYTKEFSREYKYTIGQDLKRDALVLVRGVYRVNKASDKAEHFVQLLDDFELIKFQIRLCGDLKLFTIKQQSVLIELCDIIGKQLTAWSKKYLKPESVVLRDSRVSN